MYEARQNKEKVSRRIDSAGGGTRQGMKFADNTNGKSKNVILKREEPILRFSNHEYGTTSNHKSTIQRLNPNDIQNLYIRNSYDTAEIGQHPEEAMFLHMMTRLGVNNDDAMQIWLTLLEGFQIQDFLNEAATIDVVGGQYFTNNDIRQDNELFIQVAQAVRPLLNVGNLVGLWSGGFDLSQYAQSIGCITLEESPFGFILDSLYLTNSWGRLGPLWNIISKEFVDVAIGQGAEFHIFLRTYDIGSVLIRQEVQQIRLFGPNLNIFWHPIVELDGTYFELDADCNLSENHQPCSESECLARLILFHQRQDINGESGVFPNIINHFINELNLDNFGVNEILDNIAMNQ